MLLQSSKSLHYPITVTELLKAAGDPVQRYDPVFLYSYKSSVTEGNKYGEEFKVEKTLTSRFDSETDGTLVTWNIGVGTVIDKPGVDLVEVEEPCKHETQFGGLCAICGKDMTEVDYGTTKLNSERVSINMAHTNTALYISQDEAARLEQDARRRLLDSKKLSLVVDLDQTIIQATVDPTISEWMNDESNPNHQAVKDVQAFRLADDGCWYYIKMRPGLKEFLRNVSQLYELHIYTAGSRGYAMAIVNIVDPGGKIFGDRILSRDESGSWVFKKLKRLFPIDTKMVVIIDDRGDVWSWCRNLVKVRPFDFFVGIGDINSSFLPKREQLAPEAQKIPELAAQPADTINATPDAPAAQQESGNDANGASEHQPNGDEGPSTLEQLVSLGRSDDESAVKERSDQLDETLAAQLSDRPLLQKQKLLDEADDAANDAASVDSNEGNSTDEDATQSTTGRQRQNLLHDDDNELVYVEQALREIHTRFYNSYRQPKASAVGGRVAELRQEKSPKKRPTEEDALTVPDVQDIIPDMKSAALQGTVLVFSGVIPIHVNPRRADIGKWAHTFGATIKLDVDRETTHVIASPSRRTAKVRRAARVPGIKIVTLSWLFDCLSQWRRVDETDYLIEVEPETTHQPGGFGKEARDILSSEEDEEEEGEEADEGGGEGEGEDNVDEGDGGDLGEGAGDSASGDPISRAPVTPTGPKSRKPKLSLGLDTASGLTLGDASTMGANESGAHGKANSTRSGEDEQTTPHSPIDDFEEEDWADMHAEFDDDEEDEEDESDDWQSDASQPADANPPSGSNSRKRKRAPRSVSGTDDGEDPEPKGADEGLGSELQRRKRWAFERTSSLNQVASAAKAAISSNTNGAIKTHPLAAAEADEEMESDDGFDADFEAALEAQLDADDDDDGG